jgi:hypothetical protein
MKDQRHRTNLVEDLVKLEKDLTGELKEEIKHTGGRPHSEAVFQNHVRGLFNIMMAIAGLILLGAIVAIAIFNHR